MEMISSRMIEEGICRTSQHDALFEIQSIGENFAHYVWETWTIEKKYLVFFPRKALILYVNL